MSSQQRDESNINAAEVRARMRLFEDHNLAYRLQQEEFDSHYGRNRAERQLVGTDTRQSKSEQERERDEARRVHMNTMQTISAHDENVAKQLQLEIEREAQMMREMQLRRDEELAKRLAEEDRPGSTCIPQGPPPTIPTFTQSIDNPQSSAIRVDNRPIRDLLTGDGMNLDERTQNELNRMADSSYVPLESLITTSEYPRHTTTFGVQQINTNRLDAERGGLMSNNPQSPSNNSRRSVQGIPLPGMANPRLSSEMTPYPQEEEPSWPPPPSNIHPPTLNPPPPSNIHPPTLNPPPPSNQPFTSTNPFLMDLLPPQPLQSHPPQSQPIQNVPYPLSPPINHQNVPYPLHQMPPPSSINHQPPPSYFSEFGLPPPSNLALGPR